MNTLQIKDLDVSIEGKQIIRNLNLTINSGEVHALMGPNGTGKTSLSYAILGHPKYKINKGEILLNNENILNLSVDQRARKGLFLSFQHPQEVPGVMLASFLRNSLNAKLKENKEKAITVQEFQKKLAENMDNLKMDKSFTTRSLNQGFSGGEKKRAEILQMSVLEPKIAILDETDSGLDVDSLKIVSENIKRLKENGAGILLITHYPRILEYVKPDKVHIITNGEILRSGDYSLALEIEKNGYEVA